MQRLVLAAAAVSALALVSPAMAADAGAAAPADAKTADGFKGDLSLTASVTHNDNILASGANPVGDTIYVVNPKAEISAHTEKTDVDGYAEATFTRNAAQGSENSNDYEVGGQGKARFDGGSAFIMGDWAKDTEARTVKNTRRDTVNRIVDYNDKIETGLIGTIAGVKLTGEGKLHQYDFQNGKRADGATVLQNDRDRNDWSESLKAEFSPDSMVSFFLKGEVKQVDYRLAPPQSRHNRDSHGYDLSAGATINVTGTLTGEFDAGYTKRFFPDPRLPDVQDVSLNGSLTWTPNKASSVALTLSRSLQEDVEPDSSAYISTTLGLNVSRDLSAKFTAKGTASYEWDDHKGIDRGDHVGNLGASLAYHLTSNVDLSGSYNYTVQTSAGAQAKDDYKQNVFAATLTLRY